MHSARRPPRPAGPAGALAPRRIRRALASRILPVTGPMWTGPDQGGGGMLTWYTLLVTLHIVGVIVWLGALTTLVLITLYARRTPSKVVLGPLVWWMSLWVLAPVSVAAFGLGFEAAEVGHWPEL